MHRGEFGVCSRNQQLKETDNAYWRVVKKYGLQEQLLDGTAIQFELCGPKIKKNRMGLKDVDGYMFQMYDIKASRYVLPCGYMPQVPVVHWGNDFQYSVQELQDIAMSVTYANSAPAEGIVVRAEMENIPDPSRPYIALRPSFKVINLNYKD